MRATLSGQEEYVLGKNSKQGLNAKGIFKNTQTINVPSESSQNIKVVVTVECGSWVGRWASSNGSGAWPSDICAGKDVCVM